MTNKTNKKATAKNVKTITINNVDFKAVKITQKYLDSLPKASHTTGLNWAVTNNLFIPNLQVPSYAKALDKQLFAYVYAMFVCGNTNTYHDSSIYTGIKDKLFGSWFGAYSSTGTDFTKDYAIRLNTNIIKDMHTVLSGKQIKSWQGVKVKFDNITQVQLSFLIPIIAQVHDTTNKDVVTCINKAINGFNIKGNKKANDTLIHTLKGRLTG